MYDNKNEVTLKNYTVKPLFDRKPSDLVMAAVLILLSIFGVSAVFWDGIALGYTIVYLLFFACVWIFLKNKAQKPNLAFTVCGALSAVCSLSFCVTSNMFLKSVILIVTAVSALLFFASLSGRQYQKSDTGFIEYGLDIIIKIFGDLSAVAKSFFAKKDKKSKVFISVIIGVACALPALIVIIPLLLKSDEAFYSLIHSLFDDLTTTIQKTIFGVAVSVFVIGAVFSIKYNTEESQKTALSIKANNISILSFLCVLSLVYIVYLFSQLAYFFSAFSSILPENYEFTYSEYARRGFFELCVISAINLLIVFVVSVISNKTKKKIPLLLRVPCTFIISFTLIIIFTAFSKMVMYINAYGFTVKRVLVSAFMIWMAVLFITLIIRIFTNKPDVLIIGLLTALIILSVLGIGNVNAQVAKYNYNAYRGGNIKMDVEYMSELGDEGVPYLYKLSKSSDKGISKQAKKELSHKKDEYKKSIFNYSYSYYKAKKVLNRYN